MNFQDDTLRDLAKEFKQHNVVFLAHYTGAGKTNVFLRYCETLIKENPKIKIGISSYLTNEIRTQIWERSEELGLASKATVIGGGNLPDWNKNIFIFNPQSIYKKKIPVSFDFFIVDEAQAGFIEDFRMIRKIIASKCKRKHKLLIVTATPWDILALPEFKGAPVLKRPLSQGLLDGRLNDFKFCAEEAQVTFNEDDFTYEGELKKSTLNKSFAVLKSTCIGKMKNIIKRYDKQLGEKVLVIVPPGNLGEIATDMATFFDGKPFLQQRGSKVMANNLADFKDPKGTRFLFVIHKCGVGFDYPELTSVIDMTMTRNLMLLVQRTGRVARAYNNKPKHYFYLYDKGLSEARLGFLVMNLADFADGNYDGWTTRTSKYMEHSPYTGYMRKREFQVNISEIIKELHRSKSIKNQGTFTFATNVLPKKRTLESALLEARQYESQYKLFQANPSLLKWFRKHGHKEELNQVLPLQNPRKWHESSVVAFLEKNKGIIKSRTQLHRKASGVEHWIRTNKREDLCQKYFGDPVVPTHRVWTHERVVKEILPKLKSWNDLRKYAGVRTRMSQKLGGMTKYKKIWERDFKRAD